MRREEHIPHQARHGHEAPPENHTTHQADDHAAHQHRPARGEHMGHEASSHAGHDKHEEHSPEMFRKRFWLSFLLTLPILYFDMHFQEWFGYQAVTFPGVAWVQPLLSVALYLYGGGVFVQGTVRELRARPPDRCHDGPAMAWSK